MLLRLRATAPTARPAPRRCWPRAPFLRRAISAVAPAPPWERVAVPCRSNGRITVDVFHAAKPSSPVLLYLPAGPIVPNASDEDDFVISLLRETTAATVARINYRASSTHQFPAPVHDVLFAFDWIKENLLRDEFDRPYLARLGVCGELFGGSLATMLALTECRLGESRIGAAAVNNPIVDWVFPEDLPAIDPAELPEPLAPDETAFPAEADSMASPQMLVEAKPDRKTRKRTPKTPPLTAWQRYSHNKTMPTCTLSAERDVLFRRPEDYLDRFASPIHFFRSPHAQLLLPQQDDIFASSQPDEILDMEAQMSLQHYNLVNGQAPTAPEVPVLSRCRSYARNYPSAGSQIGLPAWNITTGTESPLSDQAAELVKVLRRSVARHALKSHAGRTRWHDKSEKAMYEEHAEERVHLNHVPGLGLWSDKNHDERSKNVQNVGGWMKERLAPGNT